MSLMTPAEHAFAKAVSDLLRTNPFTPERIKAERRALGGEFQERDAVWNIRPEPYQEPPNNLRLAERSDTAAMTLRHRLAQGTPCSDEEARLYEDMVLYTLYYRFAARLQRVIELHQQQPPRNPPVGCYGDFVRDCGVFLWVPGRQFPETDRPDHIFACFFQVRRAFHHIFNHIVGGSLLAARLRAAAWQSIFTHDIRRYQRSLYDKMQDMTTLIVGPSGAGKELVARAIGLSQYVPFDQANACFALRYPDVFFPLNISALSPGLVESELFGHRRGSFTGAAEDRAGWFEVCPRHGSIFLDEVGDIEPGIQVKLLRVLQTRVFQRIGDTQPRRFEGKVMAATNRDLGREIETGRFRPDFYYRLCSDVVRTPSLHDLLADNPAELRNMVLFVARRVAGDDAEELADEAVRWIEDRLGPDYPWRGNFRELEQCVRSVLIHREYHPALLPADEAEDLAASLRAGSLTAEGLLRRYCALVYHQTGSFVETARKLGLDRRTVRSKAQSAAAPRKGAR